MIDSIPHCLICGKEPKKSAHIFGNCPIAATVWSLAHIAPHDFVPGEHGGISLGLTILDRNRKEASLMATILWLLWSNQNAVLHGKPSQTAECIFIHAKEFIEEFKAAKKESFGKHTATILNAKSCKPPF
ncbi:hypothetical protein AXF42_Ash006686 [Apostasia shenzhenica]|uniref:Reverse transcriptase zinc-binding domain-containing protein n=1 Tax=Apostasia shenzhenica TaxID=1088818 RepID=A0A2I0AIU1_9ASPA|nr:hypothetical protein AXF42_Ash006686 [Apostasia shenzhenica]